MVDDGVVPDESFLAIGLLPRDLTLELVLEIDDVAFGSTNTGEETIFACPEEKEKVH